MGRWWCCSRRGRTAETKLEGIDFDGHVGDRLAYVVWWFWEILKRLGYSRRMEDGKCCRGIIGRNDP